MTKRLFSLMVVAVMALGVFGLAACEPPEGEMNGQFYTLQEAYNENLLTVEDLQSIANHLNNGTLPADTLGSAIETGIKETAAENMRNDELSPIPEAKADGFTVQYYGTYNGSIAVLLSNAYLNYPAEDLDITIEVAGVSFHYNDPRTIEIWKSVVSTEE